MAETKLSDHYAIKDESYYTNARADYVALLPDDPQAHILELGCGDGATGALALKSGKCKAYTGIEMFKPMAAVAQRKLTTVHVGDIEHMHLPYAPGTFDALIMSEVLEHLVNPQAVLNNLVTLLKPGALIFASSPNASQWAVVRNLMHGRFDYTEQGVMDRTHLRWFTPKSFRELFENAGVDIHHLRDFKGGRKQKLIEMALTSRFKHLSWEHVNLHGKKRP